MVSIHSVNEVAALRTFSFESYGVNVTIESREQELVDQAEEVARKSLLDRIRSAEPVNPDYLFRIDRTHYKTHSLFQNGERLTYGMSRKLFFKSFDSILRVAIARDAVNRVFLHAGAVGWKGKAILIPADSYQGKSTLVAELVRQGAEYYSDEYAILDKDGNVHPFPRPISMRTYDGELAIHELEIESLGGIVADKPIPVGLILITKYVENGKWRPKLLTPGQGMLEIMPHTISLGNHPDFSLSVLKNIASRAIIASSYRGSAKNFAKTLISFVDKHVI